MTVTKVSDVIVPSVFARYVIDRSAELSAFWRSGLISAVPDLGGNFTQGGSQQNMPFWNDLEGDDQLLDDSTDLTIGGVTSGQDVAIWHGRALVYGGTDLAAALAGDDPVGVAGDLMAAKWVRQQNALLVNTLAGAVGALAAESPTVNTLDISGLSGSAAYIDGAAFIDTGQTMGENKDRLAAVAMHSAVEAYLRKAGEIIDFIPDSETKETIATFMGKMVIIDDKLAPTPTGSPAEDVYDTYLFGMGALGYAEGRPKVPAETDRAPLTNGGQEYIVSRRHFILHPRGIKWDPASGVPAKQTPSNTELADAGNWTRVWDAPNIRIAKLRHKIG